MFLQHLLISSLLLFCLCSSFYIDWTSLQNPILSYPNEAIKDYYVQDLDGKEFFVFFSAFFTGTDGVFRCHVVEVQTLDFKRYSSRILDLDGVRQGWIGMASPNVTPLPNRRFLLTFNSWGDEKGKPNQLFYLLSNDLTGWGDQIPKPLAPELTKGNRAIDAAVAYANNKYYLIWKNQAEKPVMGVSDNLDGNWTLLGTPSLLSRDGSHNTHENFEFMYSNGKWYLLCTAYNDTNIHVPYLYTMKGNPTDDRAWLSWIDGYELNIRQTDWNDKEAANAASINDWTDYDGFYYLWYAGRNDTNSFEGRGHERLGVSRSKDLVVWVPAGSS